MPSLVQGSLEKILSTSAELILLGRSYFPWTQHRAECHRSLAIGCILDCRRAQPPSSDPVSSWKDQELFRALVESFRTDMLTQSAVSSASTAAPFCLEGPLANRTAHNVLRTLNNLLLDSRAESTNYGPQVVLVLPTMAAKNGFEMGAGSDQGIHRVRCLFSRKLPCGAFS